MMPPPMMTTLDWVGKSAMSEPSREGGFVHLAHLGHAYLDRISTGRRIDRGHLGELVEMLELHAELGQRMRYADLAPEIEGPLHEAIESGVAQVEPARQPYDFLLDG